MASSRDVLCGVCDAHHITKYAEVWCPECEEGFCSDCKTHHDVSKATRTHGIIPVDQYQKLPSSISEITHHCKEHGMKYTNYCTHHNTLCCPDCISTTHVKCTDYQSIQQLIKMSKTSALLDNIELSLDDISNNIIKVIDNREQNLAGIQQQRQKCHDEMKHFRAKIISNLDILEQQFIKELNAAENKVKLEINDLIKSLSKEQKIVHELKCNITALKQHGSDLQTFFGIQTYQQEVEKLENSMESLSEDGCLNQMKLKCNIDEKIFDNFMKITSFGSVSIQTGPPTLVIKTKKHKQAHTTVIQQPSSRSINDISLSLSKRYNIPKILQRKPRCYRGCIIHMSGKLILTNSSRSTLLVLNRDGLIEKEIPFSVVDVNDVTTVDDRTVAVSTSDGIHIINIETKKEEKYIKRRNLCYGITYHKGTLMWCESSIGIQKMDLSDWSITTLVEHDRLPEYSYITTHGDKIYQTNYKDKTVTCHLINGQKQWEYKNEALLVDPTCITVDNNSNIYVTSAESHSLLVLTTDGKEGRQLLDKSSLEYPWGIYFEKYGNNLLVVNNEGPAYLYHICLKDFD